VAGTLTIAEKASLTVQGVLANSGEIALAAKAHGCRLIVGTAGLTLSGGGTVNLGTSPLGALTGAAATATLTNIDNTILGAGVIGSGKMVLINDAAGLIEQTGAASLTLNTGTARITNVGIIEATGTGGATIASAVANAGVLEADMGNLTVSGAVTGNGLAVIDAGTLDFTSSFSQSVTFIGSTGELELANSQGYTGAISGFSKTGGTTLDLGDIAFVSASEATFSGTSTSGVLTVTDGTHTARITLSGDYENSTFVASSDRHGGTDVVTQKTAAVVAPPHALVAAMAAFGASAAPHAQLGETWAVREPLLTTPRVALA
jgi:hypothetical protein